MTAAGSPIQPLTPLNIISPTGKYVRNDNATDPAYVGNGNGLTPPEQYVAYHPNLTDPSNIDPYESMLLQSVETGLWCQLRALPSNGSRIGMICDQPTPGTATVMTYTGSGLSYNGIDLVASAPGQPLLLENTTSAPVAGGSVDGLTIAPALTGAHDQAYTWLLYLPVAWAGVASVTWRCCSPAAFRSASVHCCRRQAVACIYVLLCCPACRPAHPSPHAPQAAGPHWQAPAQ